MNCNAFGNLPFYFHTNLFDGHKATHDDSEDKNLSWLYNYKLNELPHLSPEVNRSRTETGLQVDKLIQEATFGEPDSPLQKSTNEQTVIDSPVIT